MDTVTLPAEGLRKAIHDINGQIFVIRGNAEIGLSKMDDPAALEKHFHKILSRCDALMADVTSIREMCGASANNEA